MGKKKKINRRKNVRLKKEKHIQNFIIFLQLIFISIVDVDVPGPQDEVSSPSTSTPSS